MIHFISLGTKCHIANQIKLNGLRDASYPLDWMETDNPNSLEKIIEHDFKDFFLPAHLQAFWWSDRWHVRDKCYMVSTPHYFSDLALSRESKNPAMMMQISEDFFQKHQRRSQRFLTVMNSSDMVFLFRKCKHTCEAVSLASLLNEKWPKGRFHLVCLPNSETNLSEWESLSDERIYIAPIPWSKYHIQNKRLPYWTNIFSSLLREAVTKHPSLSSWVIDFLENHPASPLHLYLTTNKVKW